MVPAAVAAADEARPTRRGAAHKVAAAARVEEPPAMHTDLYGAKVSKQ